MASPANVTLFERRLELIELTKKRNIKNNPKGLANTIRGVQMKRSSIMALEGQLKNLSIPALILVGENDGPCIKAASLPCFFLENLTLIDSVKGSLDFS